MTAPRFVSIFPRNEQSVWKYMQQVSTGVIDKITHVGYDEAGCRWGLVERDTFTPMPKNEAMLSDFRPGRPRSKKTSVVRGWVRLPTPILDEEWKEVP